MDNQKLEQMVREVMQQMSSPNGKSVKTESNAGVASSTSGKKMGVSDYPLGEKNPDLVKTPTGRTMDQLNLEGVIKGEIGEADLKITPETLYMQADIADDANRSAFASNLRRAAELINVEDDKILNIYDALRPNRSTKQELLDIAADLEDNYNAKINAEFIREAARVYEQRDILRRD